MPLLTRERAIFLVLGSGILAQLALLINVGFLPLREQVRSVSNLPALKRSAILSFGDDFAAYLEFLNNTIPEEASVVVPPMKIDNVFGNPALMQYFLFPRVIRSCPSELTPDECVDRFKGEGAYYLVTGIYYSAEQLESSSYFIPFSGQRGVLVPHP